MNKKRTRSKHKVPFKCNSCGKVEMIPPCRVARKRFCSNECKIEFQKGIPKSEETKKKISQAKGGVKKESRICEECEKQFETEKWRKNRFCGKECAMRHVGKNGHHGTWKTGLSPDDPKMIEAAKKQSKALKKRFENGDIEIWNKGLTKETDDRVADYVQKQTEWRNTDSPEKEAWRESLRIAQVKAHAEGKYPNKFTKPEQQTWAYLESLGYTVKAYSDRSDNDTKNTWYHQYPFFDTFVPDFACPDLQCIIEVDGCAYHAHDPSKCSKLEAKFGWSKFAEGNAKRDRKKHWFYHSKGWKWANVWECEADVGDFHRIERDLT